MLNELYQPKDEPDFWMVWSPQGRAPTVKHGTAHGAMEEAKRLARNVRGAQFYVLHAVAKATIPEPPVHVTKLAHDLDQEIPF